jgi:hypothetical protein
MKDRTRIQWMLPAWAAELIRQTIEMDSRSGAFDPALRDELAAAFETITETERPPPSKRK